MRQLITLLLLTLTLIPAAYSFNDNKRVIDIYQEQLEKLRLSHAKLERLTQQQADKVALIQRLIADYQNALETTTQGIKDQYLAQLEQHQAGIKTSTQQMTDKYQALLEQYRAELKTATQQIKDKYQAQLQQLTAEHADTQAAYRKKLEVTADLTEHYYLSARKTDHQIKSLLTELGQSAEQILKLTQVISTLQQDMLDLRQQLLAQQQQDTLALQQEMSALRQQLLAQQQQEMSALRQEIEHNRDVMRGQTIRTFNGHTSHVFSVAFSPKGDYALSGSQDKTLKLWDVSTGQLVRTLSGHTNRVYSVAFSPNGRYALSGSYDYTLKLWDVSTGQLVRTLSGHTNYVRSVAFSPKGDYALSGSDDNTLKLWAVLAGSSDSVE